MTLTREEMEKQISKTDVSNNRWWMKISSYVECNQKNIADINLNVQHLTDVVDAMKDSLDSYKDNNDMKHDIIDKKIDVLEVSRAENTGFWRGTNWVGSAVSGVLASVATVIGILFTFKDW